MLHSHSDFGGLGKFVVCGRLFQAQDKSMLKFIVNQQTEQVSGINPEKRWPKKIPFEN